MCIYRKFCIFVLNMWQDWFIFDNWEQQSNRRMFFVFNFYLDITTITIWMIPIEQLVFCFFFVFCMRKILLLLLLPVDHMKYGIKIVQQFSKIIVVVKSPIVSINSGKIGVFLFFFFLNQSTWILFLFSQMSSGNVFFAIYLRFNMDRCIMCVRVFVCVIT